MPKKPSQGLVTCDLFSPSSRITDERTHAVQVQGNQNMLKKTTVIGFLVTCDYLSPSSRVTDAQHTLCRAGQTIAYFSKLRNCPRAWRRGVAGRDPVRGAYYGRVLPHAPATTPSSQKTSDRSALSPPGTEQQKDPRDFWEGRKTGDRRGHAEPANKTQAGASEGCAAGAKHGQPQPKKTGKNVRKPKNEASSQSQGVRGCSGRFPCVLPEFPPPRDHRGQRAPVQEWRVYTVVYVRTSVVTYTVPGRSAESHDAPGAVTVNCVCRWDK
jgi:hypothetical protein